MALQAHEARIVGYAPNYDKTAQDVPVVEHRTVEARSVVTAANYWNSRVGDFVKGTWINSVAASGGTPAGAVYLVTANDGTTVTAVIQTL